MLAAGRRGNIRTAGVLGVEKKWYDTGITGSLTTTLDGLHSTNLTLCTIPQGATASQRVGQEAIIKQVQICIEFCLLGITNAAITVGSNKCRVMVIVDHQCNGADLLAADVLEDSTDINSFRNLKQTARFTVLHDGTYTFNPQISGDYDDQATHQQAKVCKTVKIFKTMNMKVSYEGTTAVVANITDNNIMVFAMMAQASPVIDFDASYRTRYFG